MFITIKTLNLEYNHLIIVEMIDDSRSRQPFPRISLRKAWNYIKSLLDQEQNARHNVTKRKTKNTNCLRMANARTAD